MRPATVQGSASVVSLTSAFGKKPGFFLIFLLYSVLSWAQKDQSPISLDNVKNISLKSTTPAYSINSKKSKRQLLVAGINVVGYGGSLIILNNTWYKNYPRT